MSALIAIGGGIATCTLLDALLRLFRRVVH